MADQVEIRATRQILVAGVILNPGQTALVSPDDAHAAVEAHKAAEYVSGSAGEEAVEPVPTPRERTVQAAQPSEVRVQAADEVTRQSQDSQVQTDMERFSGATAADAAAAQQETKQRQASVQAPAEPAPAPAPSAAEAKPAEAKPVAPK